MGKRGFLARHRIVRNTFREDLLFFFLPWILVFTAGLFVSGRDGWTELPFTLWRLIRHPQSVVMLSAANLAGIALFVAGFVIILTGHITLGRFYSSFLVIQEDHELIRHGIYRFIRHPIYLGTLMVSIGLPVYAPSLYGILIMAVTVPIFLIRIRIEERLLTEEFGDAYRAYQQETRKLIPFIY
jgi:protein-S-isoprenylcysteine O-methyltransferase Ste14